MQDAIVIGGGPAGISAALTLQARGKRVRLISNDPAHSPLAKAERVDNYPGLPEMDGRSLLEKMAEQTKHSGVEWISGRALIVMPAGDMLYVSVGQEVYSGAALILATGIARGKTFPGESELLGAGVSYCATCDGMLYRGKPVVVIGLAPDAEHEAEFLRSIGCQVTFLGPAEAKDVQILGQGRVNEVRAGGQVYACEGAFILRESIAPAALVPGLEIQEKHICVQRDMSTNIPGVFAAGDCVGAPYQVAKAVGEGNIAALAAAAYMDRLNKSNG